MTARWAAWSALWCACWAALPAAVAAGLGAAPAVIWSLAGVGVGSVAAWGVLAAVLALGLAGGRPVFPAGPSDGCAAGECVGCSGFLCSCRCHKRSRQLAPDQEYTIPVSSRNEWN